MQSSKDNDCQHLQAACHLLAARYHHDEPLVLQAAETYSPYQFIRLFITVHGMKPSGVWQTHTYARFTDQTTSKDHFFLIPMQKKAEGIIPFIRFENNALKIDEIETAIFPQSIPHTTPFWYFHYDPNKEDQPFYSMTLNLSPACLEKCVLCAGAKTGRVNNGMDRTLEAVNMVRGIFQQHPEAAQQLQSVAVVTGCFNTFDELKNHLTDVRYAVKQFANPTEFRVLEHNLETPEQFAMIVGELGYDLFITLECFDQEIRNIALNGKVGRKGRNSQHFIEMIKTYAQYLETQQHDGIKLIRVTYLVGLDSLSVMESFFQILASINQTLKKTKIVPWLSIFTTYNSAMQTIQHKDFSFGFIANAMALAEKYIDKTYLLQESGGTAEGYARGLY